MTITDLKEKLLKLNIFLDNDYLNSYCDLIFNNLETDKEKYKTQKHHVIPISYYKNTFHCKTKKEAEEYSAKNNNLIVNLHYCDHVIAHCRLVLCSKENEFKYKMMCAAYKLLKTSKMDISEAEREWVIHSEDYQKAYELSKKINSEFNPMNIETSRKKHDQTMSRADTRKKLSTGMKLSRSKSDKKIHIHKDRNQIRVSEEDLPKYLADGWKRGNPKGMVYIHKEKITKKIWPEELNYYFSDGWETGPYCLKTIKSEEEAEEYRRTKVSKINKSKPKGFNKSPEFRASQSERLKTYYRNNPGFKTASKKSIKIYLNNEEFLFDKIMDAEKFLNLPIGKGRLSSSLKEGKILIKSCKYYDWKIVYYKKEGE